MTFSVVSFPEEGDCVAVVPRLWLKGGLCYWPPHSITSRKSFILEKFVRSCSPPGDTWEAVPYELIKHADTWEAARVYSQRSENGSSVETTDDEVTRKRRRMANPKYQAADFGDSDGEVPSRTSRVLDVPHVPEFAGPLPPQGHTSTPQHPVDCSPGGWATPSSPRQDRAVLPGNRAWIAALEVLGHSQYSPARERYSPATERYSLATERYSLATERYSLATERYSLATERYSLATERYSPAPSGVPEYLAKIKRQTEEIVHLRAQLALQSVSDKRQTEEIVNLRDQLALQSGPGNSLLRHMGTMSEELRSVSNQVATVLACVQANGPVGSCCSLMFRVFSSPWTTWKTYII
ncbi:hypothetical protein UPYG_G00029070 [Umbra pygmaea]|uniref:Uncharacterized protein n=1 Tax=Umbra pygmaea TaxID=75934 RepID=A0ABD0XQA9_UMBPY